MNCAQCKEDLAAYLEGLLDAPQRGQIDTHLADCLDCRNDLEEFRQLTVSLGRAGSGVAKAPLENHVFDRILRDQAVELRRIQMRKRFRVLGIGGACAAAVALAIVVSLWRPAPDGTVRAAEVFAKASQAAEPLSSIHLEFKVRTPPADNFLAINADAELVPVHVWKQFGTPLKWRVEKPGRVAVMDGSSAVMLIKPDRAVKLPVGAAAAFDAGWLLAMADVRSIVANELHSALAKGWEMKLTHEKADDGALKPVVTVEARSGLPADNYMKDKSFDTSDTRRIYRFDGKTGRLAGLQIYLRRPAADVLICEVTHIDYDQPIDAGVFSLQLPKDVVWYQKPSKLPDNEKYQQMSPQQVARAFLEACAKEDWEEVGKFWPLPPNARLKQALGGLKIRSIGEPFQAMPYGGWFVPYEVELKTGQVKKQNMAVRNDNPANRYVVDGGV